MVQGSTWGQNKSLASSPKYGESSFFYLAGLISLADLDPSQDTPVEILHTILLGIVKYLWHNIHTSWSVADRDLFVIRLQSTDIDGLSVPPIRAAYMMQYRNGLIGKHFKTLMQTMVFHVHGIVSPEQFLLIKAMGSLGALLWVPEIGNMEEYIVRHYYRFQLKADKKNDLQSDIDILIGNVLDAFALIDPAKIIDKMKLQVLPHLVQDIPRFGPAIRYSTEIFECYNAVFRLCSVLSNHQAPSRDIANKFASMDRLKHILSGGYWKENEEWICAGPKVRDVLHKDSFIQGHLGWVPARKPQLGPLYLYDAQTVIFMVLHFTGNIQAKPKSKFPAIPWHETLASAQIFSSETFGFPNQLKWRPGVYVVAQSGDECKVGSWIFVRQPEVRAVCHNSFLVLIVFWEESCSCRSYCRAYKT